MPEWIEWLAYFRHESQGPRDGIILQLAISDENDAIDIRSAEDKEIVMAGVEIKGFVPGGYGFFQIRSKKKLLRWETTQELSIPFGLITAEVHISAGAAQPPMPQDPEPYH